MNKFTSILLSIFLLGQSFQVSALDVLHLDDLYLHTIEHYQKTGDSLLDFISLHYGNKKFVHSKEHSQHKNLPFQQELNLLNLNIFYLQESNNKNDILVLLIIVKSYFYYIDFYSKFELQSLFQPPIGV